MRYAIVAPPFSSASVELSVRAAGPSPLPLCPAHERMLTRLTHSCNWQKLPSTRRWNDPRPGGWMTPDREPLRRRVGAEESPQLFSSFDVVIAPPPPLFRHRARA